MGEILEIAMVVLFGASWPANVIKSYKSRTAKGKSLLFLILILVGYLCGITAKCFYTEAKWYVVFFYILNTVMVTADLVLYFRNRRLDKLAEAM
ncbi:MAG: hypothetical protein MJ085_01075 [Clostridia bacterium]|nr:hypothetical protein [Clostridia bacterium]